MSSGSSRRRRIRNLIVSPATQIRYGALFLALTIAANIVLTALATNLYYAWMNGTMETSQKGVIVTSLALCVLAYILIYGFSFLLGLLISHKTLGPTVPIQRYIEQLQEGKYSDRLKLRDQDEPRMIEIANALNALATKLEQQNPRGG